MPYYTPLRYPGGKRRLAAVVTSLLQANNLRNIHYAEPYAGGAAIALTLLFEEHASVVHINDLSRPVYAFWYAVLNENSDLCQRIRHVRISMAEWRRQRAVYEQQDFADLADLGFAALFLNRTNRSGIISGGVIGGKKQQANWLIDARFNKHELIQRIKKIGRYATRIRLYNQDALDFTTQVLPRFQSNLFTFFDPPYIDKGEDLYLNNYAIRDHRKIAACVSKLQHPWIVTYDLAATRHRLYHHRRLFYGLPYSAQDRREGREVMFFSDRLRLPRVWRPSVRLRLSPPNSEYPFYGMLAPTRHRR